VSLFLHHCERNEEEIVRRRLHVNNQSDRFILVQASRGQTRNFMRQGQQQCRLSILSWPTGRGLRGGGAGTRARHYRPGQRGGESMIKNHIGAIKYFICHYNKVIIGLAEPALYLQRYPLSSNSLAAYPIARCVLRERGGSNVALLPEQVEGVGKGDIRGQVRFVADLFNVAA
jgi:hypothetical protein